MPFAANPSRARADAAITTDARWRRAFATTQRVRGTALTYAAVVALACMAAPPALAKPAHPPARGAAMHDVHLTYSRVVVDGASILWRVRLFRDDLEKTLAAWSKNPAFKAAAPGADSVFASYFNAQVPVTANGKRVSGKVIESGRDADVTDQDMWWYLLELPAPAPITSFGTRVGLMFEHFTDQRNVLTLLKMPGEERHSMFFVPGDAKLQTLSF